MKTMIHVLNVVAPYRWEITIALVGLIFYPPWAWPVWGRLRRRWPLIVFRAGMLSGHIRARLNL